jgi:SAM-dependent methyltransferase
LAEDLQSLITMFIDCEEYKQKYVLKSMVPLNCPPMNIEAVTSRRQLALLKSRIRETWTQLGKVRPHHSVLTGTQFLPQRMSDASIESFYASGVDEAETVAAMLERFSFSRRESKICVEYGCGLGRVTLALAKMFHHVHGYDISATHLELAGNRARETRVENVTFRLCSAESIVEDLKSLRVRGIGIFQLPTYMIGYSFQVQGYLASARSQDMEMHCLPQSEVFALIADCGCKLLEVREEGSVGHDGRWISNMFVVERMTDRAVAASSANEKPRD